MECVAGGSCGSAGMGTRSMSTVSAYASTVPVVSSGAPEAEVIEEVMSTRPC